MMNRYPFFRLRYVGTLADDVQQPLHHQLEHSFNLLGRLSQWQEFITPDKCDAVFVCLSQDNHFDVGVINEYCDQHNIQFNVVSHRVPMISAQTSIQHINGFTYLSYQKVHIGRAYRFIKRAVDIVVSFCILWVLWPYLCLVSIWIKWVSSDGPVIYSQTRVGQYGQEFKLYKFRTMRVDAEKNGPQMVNTQGDHRVIKGGHFLRQYSIDELPQLVNILKGDMSLVGPRPERPVFVEKFSKDIPNFTSRHAVPVGLTGWAQINGRSILTDRIKEKLKHDLYYIHHHSIVLDIKILIKTLAVVIRGDNAY